MYAAQVKGGRPSIAPEKLPRAMLPQVLHSVRSARRLMKQAHDNLLIRWPIGLSLDDAVRATKVFTKNREHSNEHDAPIKFFNEVVATAQQRTRIVTSASTIPTRRQHPLPAAMGFAGSMK